MKVLVVGAGGQLGRAIVAGAPAGVAIRACGRAELDVTDSAALNSVMLSETPDVVINAAAYTKVDDAETNPELAERANGIAPGLVAFAAKNAGARTVHISTDFVFDGRKSVPYRPEDEPAPLSVYGASKWRGEQAVTAADSDALIVRTAWLYDSGPANFVGTIRRLASERSRLSIVDDQVGTPTSVRSLAAALWAIIGTSARGTHHFTDSGVASWYDFAVAIIEESHSLGLLDRHIAIEPISTREYPTAAVRPAHSVLDKSETWALLGKKAAHWRVNLRSVLEEIRHCG